MPGVAVTVFSGGTYNVSRASKAAAAAHSYCSGVLPPGSAIVVMKVVTGLVRPPIGQGRGSGGGLKMRCSVRRGPTHIGATVALWSAEASSFFIAAKSTTGLQCPLGLVENPRCPAFTCDWRRRIGVFVVFCSSSQAFARSSEHKRCHARHRNANNQRRLAGGSRKWRTDDIEPGEHMACWFWRTRQLLLSDKSHSIKLARRNCASADLTLKQRIAANGSSPTHGASLVITRTTPCRSP